MCFPPTINAMNARKAAKGISLVEVLIGVIILAMVMTGVGYFFGVLSRHRQHDKDRSFALQKSVQMLEELVAFAASRDAAKGESISDLDAFHQTSTTTILTTISYVTDPADPISSNQGQRFCRKISVLPVDNEPGARQVYVRLYLNETPLAPLAEVTKIIRSLQNVRAPTQVFDVYFIAIENILGWWTTVSEMKAKVGGVIQSIQTRNPGLEIRPHWITRLGYGRDILYAPNINRAFEGHNSSAANWVYYYPGLVRKPNHLTGAQVMFYDPADIGGRLKVDNGPPESFGFFEGYPMADQFNHTMRYPIEELFYSLAAPPAGTAPSEKSLRMILEEMNSPAPSVRAPYENAIFINVHGELLPLPPMRNYSDPAKDPLMYENVRVVTHPQKLNYDSGVEARLRVYAYLAGTSTQTIVSSITVAMRGVDLSNPTDLTIWRLNGSSDTAYGWEDATGGSSVTVTYTAPDTFITLKETPLLHSTSSAGPGGLESGDRLYNMEYIPCVIGDPSLDFPEVESDPTDSLADPDNDPKNTARWVIIVNAGLLPDGRYDVDTWMGETAPSFGPSLSQTYIWMGKDSGIEPPRTEQFQFMGDPRHVPYSDVKADHRYNWYFRQIPADYTNFDKATNNGWLGEFSVPWGYPNFGQNFDVPRYFQIYREGLLKTTAIWNNLTGFSFGYFGMGGEIGVSSTNEFPNGLPLHSKIWDPALAPQVHYADEVTPFLDGSTNPARSHLIAGLDATNNINWVSKPWLGELYPDSHYSDWVANGNLPTGTDNFRRIRYDQVPSALVGVDTITFSPTQWATYGGAPSFYNGTSGPANEIFTQTTATGPSLNVSSLTDDGRDGLRVTFNLPLPETIPTGTPFSIDSPVSAFPPHWNDPDYSGANRTALEYMPSGATPSIYYSPSDPLYEGTALMRFRNDAGTEHAFAAINAAVINQSFESGNVGQLSLAASIRGFMEAGLFDPPPSVPPRIPQLPLVRISSPTEVSNLDNPNSINVVWTSTWTRWDGANYTSDYPSPSQDELIQTPLFFEVKYSNDNGQTWKCADGLAGNVDVGVPSALCNEVDSPPSFSPFQLSWSVSSFPKGTYLLRVEVFRRDPSTGGARPHYSYHQRQIYIKRP